MAGVAAAGLCLGGWLRGRAPLGGLRRFSRTASALGAEVSILVLHEDSAAATLALDAAFAELDRVEGVLSLYRPESDVSRLNRDGALEGPHPYLVEVLRAAHEVSVRSGGRFDVTVQPLWGVFAEARARGQRPDEGAVERAVGRVDYRRVAVSERRVELGGEGMAVTLNGIAQGFAADRVLAALRAHGVEDALVDTGEIASLGRREDASAWTAGVQHPRRDDAWIRLARLDGRCLATSGDYEAAFSADRRDHHIFDPATGRSPTSLASVTVAAPSAMAADALSTAVFVLGPQAGMALVARTPGADAFLVTKAGHVLATPGFPEA